MKISQIVLLTVMVIGCAQASRRALKHENPQVKKHHEHHEHHEHHSKHRLKKLMKKKDDCGDYESEFTDIKGQLATLKTEMNALKGTKASPSSEVQQEIATLKTQIKTQKATQASSQLEIEAQKATQASSQLEIDALKTQVDEMQTLQKFQITGNLLQYATVTNQYSMDDKELKRANKKEYPMTCLQTTKDTNNRFEFNQAPKSWQEGISHDFGVGTVNAKIKAVIDIGSVVSLGAFSVFQTFTYLNNIIIYKAKDETATSPPGILMENWELVIDSPIQINQPSTGKWDASTQFTAAAANVLSVTPFKARYLMVVPSSKTRYSVVRGLKAFTS